MPRGSPVGGQIPGCPALPRYYEKELVHDQGTNFAAPPGSAGAPRLGTL